MKKSQIKPIHGSTILLNPFSKEFVSKDYLNWMNDAATTRFIQKAKNNTSIDELYSFANEMINSEKDYFFAIVLKKIFFILVMFDLVQLILI